MSSIVDDMEVLLADAHRTKGWLWVCSEPMWTTWPMEKFGTCCCGPLVQDSENAAQSPRSLTSSCRTGVRWNYTLNFSTPYARTTSPSRRLEKPPIRGSNNRVSRTTVGTRNGKLFARSRSIDGRGGEKILRFCSLYFIEVKARIDKQWDHNATIRYPRRPIYGSHLHS